MMPISSTVETTVKTTDNYLPVNTTSDLWLPSLVCVVSIVLVLSVRWIWFFWRVQQLQNKIKLNYSQSSSESVTMHATSQRIDTSYHLNKFRNILGVIGDLTAFTAQKNPIVLEELIEKKPPDLNPDLNPIHQKINPTILPELNLGHQTDDSFKSDYLKNQLKNKHLIINTATDTTTDTTINTITNTEKETLLHTPKKASSKATRDTVQDEFITTLVPAKAMPTPIPFFAHELFHYQARLTWANIVDKEQFLLLLNERPWQQSLPVRVCSDITNNDSIILGWQVIHRHELATIEALNIFKEWCVSLADATHANCKFISTLTWDNFIDEAHSLLASLDSAIILKISVPTAQLDLFTQALLAARFVQQQEHWTHSDAEQKNTIILERLWQTVQATYSPDALTEHAIFQIVIDLPHFDVLEARKIYMRIRAVTKTSTATLQSVNGLHLSEGMLDKYSREMILKQESLTQAGLIPGSKLAQDIFSPKLKNNYDLYHSPATV
jgi:hypothetical protein